MKSRDELIRKYDELAFDYGERFCRELDGKPFDRDLLKRFVQALPPGPVCDLGCGPGHVAAHLASLGADAFGMDLSPRMVEEARRRYPSLRYEVGDMLDLRIPAGSLAGIVALYAIIHLRREQLADACRQMSRALRPGGLVLVSFHQGRGELHEDEVLGKPISFDCTLFEPMEVASALEGAGFAVVELSVRRNYEIEYPTRRVYILAENAGR
jgi:SAM-dependent methyltransferase